jgi:hypothetical protein
MIDNKVRYGVLSSGTKTYFLFVSEPKVMIISPAWFISQEHYLRAWACFYAKACADNAEQQKPTQFCQFTPPTGSSKRKDEAHDDHGELPDGKRGPSGDVATNRGDKKKKSVATPTKKRCSRPPNLTVLSDTEEGYNGLTPSDDENCLEELPFVEYDTLQLHEVLGWGRNGCTFKANWDGTDVAIKQFDVAKNPGAYEKELDAYARLKADWGILVPKPLFRSESWSGNVRYLGMQLGRPRKDDDKVDSYETVLRKLANKHGLEQLDWSHYGNFVVAC